MHTPSHFKITDHHIIDQFIREHSFATLISIGERYPLATHIPLELEINAQEHRYSGVTFRKETNNGNLLKEIHLSWQLSFRQ
jgi:predicted FMN-binding regulatory protein PaiB